MPAPARPAPPRHPPADTARTDLPSRPPRPPAAPPSQPDPAAHQLRSWAWTLEPLATTSHVNRGTHPASSVNRADLAHPRPPRPSRRPARAEDQPALAMEVGVPHLLAAALRLARTCLTSPNHPND